MNSDFLFIDFNFKKKIIKIEVPNINNTIDILSFRLIKKFIKIPIKPRNINPTINSIVLYCAAILLLSNLEKNKKN